MDDSNTYAAGAPAESATPAPARAGAAGGDADSNGNGNGHGTSPSASAAAKRRRRGSRGGQHRKRVDLATDSVEPDELPDPIREGRVTDPDAADKALVRKPQIGDTRAAPFVPSKPPPGPAVVAKPASAAG